MCSAGQGEPLSSSPMLPLPCKEPAAHSSFPNPALFTSQGMGEPLNNYGAVRSAVGMMTDPRYFGL